MRAEDTTLLQVLGGCFEKNEVWDRYWRRSLPLPQSEIAARKYQEFYAEILRWKGAPVAEARGEGWQRADWGSLRMKQAGRGVEIWIRFARLWEWQNADETWEGDPMDAAFYWDEEERGR